jgi:hypothetical protein
MQYWVTTHWPQRRGESPLHNGIWVVDSKKSVINRVCVGDLVAIYESGSGKTPIINRTDGSVEKIPRQIGRQGVVELHRVTSSAFESENSEPERYLDGSVRWWRWHTDTERISSAGFVYRKDLAKLLGMSVDYPFRGFGDQQSGLKEINKSQFELIVQRYQRYTREMDFSQKSDFSRPFGGPGGGEGPAHKALKLAIAKNPALLGEEGLELVMVEYSFATGDRIDVLLRDRFGRMVAVEVEGECDEYEVAGPLQCMKYRALTAYLFNRNVQEVRSILAAPKIHKNIIEKLQGYEVESRIVGPI